MALEKFGRKIRAHHRILIATENNPKSLQHDVNPEYQSLSRSETMRWGRTLAGHAYTLRR
jgi:hypothetical protein